MGGGGGAKCSYIMATGTRKTKLLTKRYFGDAGEDMSGFSSNQLCLT